MRHERERARRVSSGILNLQADEAVLRVSSAMGVEFGIAPHDAHNGKRGRSPFDVWIDRRLGGAVDRVGDSCFDFLFGLLVQAGHETAG